MKQPSNAQRPTFNKREARSITFSDSINSFALQRVIQCPLQIETPDLIGQRRIVQGIDDMLVLQQIQETALFDQLGDLRIVSQGHNPGMIAELLRRRE